VLSVHRVEGVNCRGGVGFLISGNDSADWMEGS
jgi:hypothetical protein